MTALLCIDTDRDEMRRYVGHPEVKNTMKRIPAKCTHTFLGYLDHDWGDYELARAVACLRQAPDGYQLDARVAHG